MFLGSVCFWARWNSVEFRPTPPVLQFGLVETGVSGCGNKAYLFFLPDARFLHSDLSRDPLPLQHQLKLDTQSTFSGNTNLLFPTWIKWAGPHSAVLWGLTALEPDLSISDSPH